MRSRTVAGTRVAQWALTVMLGLAAWAGLVPTATAQTRAIGPGHEDAVLALVAPHTLGGEVAAGFALWELTIDVDRIVVGLRRPDGRTTGLVLVHPSEGPEGAPTTENFAILERTEGDDDARAARRAVIDAIRRNDHASFWTEAIGGGGGLAGLRRGQLWGDTHWVPLDGLTVIALLFAFGLLLAVRLLWDAPRWMSAALALVVATGAALRATLAPASFLGAWPWSRIYPNVRSVAEGGWLARLSESRGEPPFLDDVMQWTNFAYAAAMPLVLFSHATYLLRDRRAGLVAAAAIALLPQHIRFSRCEDGFVGSLVLTSLAFALLHGWLRDPSAKVRAALVLALPIVLYPGYLLRPLNILFIAVYAAALLFLHGETAPRHRRVVGLVLVLGVGAAAFRTFVSHNGEVVGEATSRWAWVGNSLRVLLTPLLLVISDVTRTPPALLAAALAGMVLAWRAGERRLVAFLVGWFVLFEVAHAFVVQASMQPRYHLHLVVPFLLLASTGAVRLWERGISTRRWLALGAASVVAAPWLHLGFIQDLGWAEQQEYAFVRRARAIVPEGCTVLEFVVPDPEARDLRFRRIGARAGLHASARYRTYGVWADGHVGPEHDAPTLDALLSEPPSCLYFYEGLACTTARREDETSAAACDRLRARIGGQVVAEARAPARFYDAIDGGPGPFRGDHVTFRLVRVRDEGRSTQGPAAARVSPGAVERR